MHVTKSQSYTDIIQGNQRLAQTTIWGIYTSLMSILVKRGYRTLEVDDPWLDAGFICLEQWHL